MILAAVLADLGVQSSHKTLAHFGRMDRERNCCRIKAVDATVKRRRRLLKTRFLATEKSRKKREIDSTYKSGALVLRPFLILTQSVRNASCENAQ